MDDYILDSNLDELRCDIIQFFTPEIVRGIYYLRRIGMYFGQLGDNYIKETGKYDP